MKRVLSLLLIATMLMSALTFTAFAAEEVVITTADEGCKLEGKDWKESTNSVVEGPTGGTSWYTGDTEAKAVFDASDLNGKYGVYAYITPYGSTADKVDFTITASGKATTLVTDGYEGGSEKRHWKFLGIFEFDGTDGDSVVQQMNANATSTGTTTTGTGFIRSSGVKFIKDDTNTEKVTTVDASAAPAPGKPAAKPAETEDGIIITSSDSRCKREGAGWKESTNPVVAGPNGGTSWYTFEKAAKVIYDASSLDEGNYGVYVYLTPFGTTADKIDISITASGKTTTVVTDGLHGGAGNLHWIYLGKYDFNGESGESVVQQINKDAVPVGGTGNLGALRTSGVKFVKDDKNTAAIDGTIAGATGDGDDKEETAAPAEKKFTTVPETGSILMGTEHAGFSKNGDWTQSGLAMPLEGKGYYVTKVNSTGTWYPYLNKAENVEVFYYKPLATNTEDPSLQIEVFAEGKSTMFDLDFTKPPTDWYSLGRFNFSGDGSEYIKVTKTSNTGTARLTGLKFAIKDKNTDSSKGEFYGTDLHILERMGMLIGEGDGITEEYLKKVPTRVQAAVMILRLNGVDKDAESFTGTDNFTDANLEPWAMPQLAYLKAHPELGLIGTGDNMFEPTANIDAQAYAKILLTALGYEYNVDFTWDGTLAFAKEKGIAEAPQGSFTVKDLAVMTESILDLNCKDGTPYFEKLILERDGVKDEGVYGTELTAELKAARDEAKNKKRGIIYNNDGNDVYKYYDNYPGTFDISHLDGTTINAENFLKPRTYGLEDTQVGTVFYCTGVFNSYTHESSGLTDVRVRDWSRALKEYTGKDSLTTMIDYVHSLDKEIFWSMRMNDTHDYIYEENQLDPWKQANMDLLMYRKADIPNMKFGGERWTSVDYTLTPVRQVVYDILKDTLTRYDVDGLELDFTRWPIFFKEVVDGEELYPENLERMNNLVRMIRDLTEKISIERNKPILLAIYVPDSMGLCKFVGLDIETWLGEDLVDIVSIGCHSGAFQSWEDGIGEYKDHDVQIYACLEPLNYNKGADPFEVDKNEAAIAYQAGADGIYLYNYFDINHERYDILGSPETCGPVDPNYVSQRMKYGFSWLGKETVQFVTIK